MPEPTATLAALALSLATSVFLGLRLARERNRRKDGLFEGRWPIRVLPPDAIDPAFTPGAFGPSTDAEVAFIGRGPYEVAGGTTDAEAWILAVLAKRARLIFEFGTCTGKTTYLFARNAPAPATVVTLTLPPGVEAREVRSGGDDAADVARALAESAFERFLYDGTAVAHKVVQLFGDSKTIDLAEWEGRCDLVFVDGSHAYSYVLGDSERALRLVRDGGLVVWHDYAGPRHSPGVFRALNELRRRLPLARIAGTSLVVHRKGSAGAPSAAPRAATSTSPGTAPAPTGSPA